MIKRKIIFTEQGDADLTALEKDPAKKIELNAVLKALKFMETNLRHPSLNTHEYQGFKGPNGEKVFEAYAQNKTPGAYRVFWCYGPKKSQITIIAITPHP